MKLWLVISALILSASSFAQTFYESPFVVNGQSFRFTVPPGLEEVPIENVYFGRDPNSSIYATSSIVGAFGLYDIFGNSISFSTSNRDSLSIFEADFFDRLTVFGDTSDLQLEPFVTSRNDTFFVATGIKSTYLDNIEHSIAITTFDSVTVMVMFSQTTTTGQEFLDSSFFEAVLKSYNIYETDRKSTFLREEDFIDKY